VASSARLGFREPLVYIRGMLHTPLRPSGFIEPCLPSPVPRPPTGPDWLHELKHDGFRLIARRKGNSERLFTRRGADWRAMRCLKGLG
jgi:ATP-dependent DNA ligase